MVCRLSLAQSVRIAYINDHQFAPSPNVGATSAHTYMASLGIAHRVESERYHLYIARYRHSLCVEGESLDDQNAVRLPDEEQTVVRGSPIPAAPVAPPLLFNGGKHTVALERGCSRVANIEDNHPETVARQPFAPPDDVCQRIDYAYFIATPHNL